MTAHDQALLDQADTANDSAPAPVSARGDLWTRDLTAEEWSWVLAAADQRDERAYLEGRVF